jgi:ABC-type multidrug transport system permease subunit
MFTSLEGPAAGVLPPPNTHISLFTVTARVSPVALGIGAIVEILSATGL